MKTFLGHRNKLLRTAGGLVLLSALILYFDPQQIVFSLKSLNMLWVAIAATLIVCATMIGAVNAYLIVNLENKLTFAIFLPLFWLSWAIGLLFPGQIGDMASLAMQLRHRGIGLSTGIGRILVDKLISLILMMAFAIWGACSMPFFTIQSKWLVLGLALTLLIAWQIRRISSWLKVRHSKIVNFVSTSIREIIQVIERYPQRVAGNAMLTVIKIGLTGMSYWCVFHALGYFEINLLRVIMLVAISSIVAYIPISFNGIGTVEITGVFLFSLLGLKEVDVLTSYLVLRAIVIVIAWLPAGLWMLLGRRAQVD